MTAQTYKRAKLLLLTVVLWVANVTVWPGILGYLEPAKPTLLAIVFAVAAHRLRVASWPLVVSFSLSFFLFSVALFYFSPDTRLADNSASGTGTRFLLTYFGAIIFSPVRSGVRSCLDAEPTPWRGAAV
jgi:hypothetical protein